MFNPMFMLEHLCPGIGELTRECKNWLRSMAELGVKDIHTYSVTRQPSATMADLLALDDLLAERRQLEFLTLGICSDMHPHYEAAFAFVNAGWASGIKYTLANYEGTH